MEKRNYFFLSAILTATCAMAQTLPEGMVKLLPDGVTANISDSRKPEKQKNMTVAGSPEKGYYAFFAAADAEHGEELWITDGTAAGTRLVKDICPGSASSDISYITRLGEKVIFSANDGDNGAEPWVSDGTAEGTYMLKDIHDFDSSNPIGFTQLDETRLVFAAMDADDSETYGENGQRWLWITDGTSEGTKFVAAVDCQWPGAENAAESAFGPWCRVGRKVFFKGRDLYNTTEEELWITDGTTEGTYLVKDINWEPIEGGTARSALDHLSNFYNEKCFFKAWTPDSGNEPWASDGTEEGTYEVYDSNPTVNENGIGNGGGFTFVGYAPFQGRFFFRGYHPDYGNELNATNLEKGDYLTWDIYTTAPSNEHNSYTDPGREFDGVYFFCAATGFDAADPTCYGGELHYYDPTDDQVHMHSDYFPGTGCMWVKNLTVCGGSLYWYNEGGEPGAMTCLWRLDSKDGQIQQVTHFTEDNDMVHTPRNLNGMLLFATATADKQVYSYTYRKADYDPEKDADVMEPEFRTRQEIINENSIAAINADRVSVSVGPNPTSDYATVTAAAEITRIDMYTPSGVLVLSQKGDNNVINVGGMPRGLYLVDVICGDAHSVARLVVK